MDSEGDEIDGPVEMNDSDSTWGSRPRARWGLDNGQQKGRCWVDSDIAVETGAGEFGFVSAEDVQGEGGVDDGFGGQVTRLM